MKLSKRLAQVFTLAIFTKEYWVGSANVDPDCFCCNESYCNEPGITFANCPRILKIQERRKKGILTLDMVMHS